MKVNADEVKKVIEYVEGKKERKVTHFAFATVNRYIVIVPIDKVLAHIKHAGEGLLDSGNGIHLKKYTFIAPGMTGRNSDAYALLHAGTAYKVETLKGWTSAEIETARIIRGKRIGGLNHHAADAINTRLGIKVEVKGLRGWMDGTPNKDDFVPIEE